MKEIRNMLLDCRTALRKSNPKFEDTPLRETLDDMIIELSEADSRLVLKEQHQQQHADAAANSNRVAYAWQSVAREFRRSHADVYQQMAAAVLKRLDANVLDDADDEIEVLQDTLMTRDAELRQANEQLLALHTALAEAVPHADTNSGSDAELAQQRLQLLVDAAASGGGLPKPAPASVASRRPARVTLQAVAAGKRSLTPQEREWCTCELMVLSDDAIDMEQLLADGDAALAQRVLEGPAPQPAADAADA